MKYARVLSWCRARWADLLAALLLVDAIGRIVRGFIEPTGMCSLRNTSLYCRLAMLAVTVLVPLLYPPSGQSEARPHRSKRTRQCWPPLLLGALVLLMASGLLLRYEQLLHSNRVAHRKQLWPVGVALAAVVCCCAAALMQLPMHNEENLQACSRRLLVASLKFMHTSTECITDARFRTVPIVLILLFCCVAVCYVQFKRLRMASNSLFGFIIVLLLVVSARGFGGAGVDPWAGPFILWACGGLNPFQQGCPDVHVFATLSNHTLRYIDGACPEGHHRQVVLCGHLDRIPTAAATGLNADSYLKAVGQCKSSSVQLSHSQPLLHIDDSVRYLRAFCGAQENYFVHIPAVIPTVRNTRQLRQQGPSMLTLNFDGLSARQFEMHLPKTARLLREQQLSGHTAYRFRKYHAVACCTVANECLFLTGQTALHGRRKREKCTLPDGFTETVPRLLLEAGFEGFSAAGMCQPTYWMLDEQEHGQQSDYDLLAEYCHPEYDVPSATQDREGWNGPYKAQARCLAQKSVFEHTIDAVEQWLHQRQAPSYSYVNVLDSHEASMTVTKTLDLPLAAFLERTLHRHPNLLLVLKADHGLHMGPYFELSYAGDVEQAFPLMALLMPKPMLEAHPKVHQTLEHNQGRLTSPLDLYRTMLHLAHPSFPADDGLQLGLGKAVSAGTVSYNLFTERVPKDRKCSTAGIDSARCWDEASKDPWEPG